MTTTNKTPRFCGHKPECDLADNEQAHEEFLDGLDLDGLDLGVAELPTSDVVLDALHEALAFTMEALRIAVPNSDEPEHVAELPTVSAPERLPSHRALLMTQAVSAIENAQYQVQQYNTDLAVEALSEAVESMAAAMMLPHNFEAGGSTGEAASDATPEPAAVTIHRHPSQVAGARTAVAEAMLKGAGGVLVVALYESGAIEEVACGHVTVNDLAMIGARLTVTAGSWDGGQ